MGAPDQPAGVPNVQDLLLIIQQQNQAISFLQQTQAAQNQSVTNAGQARQRMIADAAAIDDIGGIYGYRGGDILEPEEAAFHKLLVGMGINSETADEVFRQGIDGTASLRRLTTEQIKSTIYNITRNKSPDCPDPSRVFLGAAFED